MKNSIICLSVILLFSFRYIADIQAQFTDKGKPKVKEPLDYVNPNIGGIGHLLVATDPVVHLPDGSIRLSSNPWPDIYDRYLADKVFSFSLRDVVRYGTETIPSWIMASTGNIKVTPAKMASNYDHNFERRQCVTVTLNAAYESWCIAQIAKALNRDADYEYFIRHAHGYQNVFNSETGFMSPKTADGKWIEPFNPNLSGGQGCREYFSELKSWMWTWYVPHDIGGLVNLLGGREKFVAKLDALFQEQYQIPKYHFLSQFPDQTGLIGNYAHGNEMVRIIPYLYNYEGSPWKTQKRVREIMDVWYGPGPLGICGDEDGGMMSLWYIYSAMGIYSDPYIPGYPVWQIGSPVFEKSTINLGNNKTFIIEAKNVSAQNKYVQSATFNGKPLDKPWFDHSDLLKGGTLILIMGPRPDKQWGTKPQAAPPSMTVSGGL